MMINQIIKSYPVLSDEKTRQLIKKYQETGDKEAKDILILSNIRLIVKVSLPWVRYGLEEEDLFNEGILGLHIALDKFDLSRNVRFSTYAWPWIRQMIGRYIHNTEYTIRLPLYAQEKIGKIERYIQKFERKHQRFPDRKEIKKEVPVDDHILDWIFMGKGDTVSLNTIVGDEEDSNTELGDFISDGQNTTEDIATSAILIEEMKEVMKSRLKEQEYEILCLRFGLNGNAPMTLESVGRKYGVTRERIRQIEKKAICKLKRSRKFRDTTMGAGG